MLRTYYLLTNLLHKFRQAKFGAGSLPSIPQPPLGRKRGKKHGERRFSLATLTRTLAKKRRSNKRWKFCWRWTVVRALSSNPENFPNPFKFSSNLKLNEKFLYNSSRVNKMPAYSIRFTKILLNSGLPDSFSVNSSKYFGV